MKSNSPLIRQSKFLSLILRHEPEKIGLVLDAQSWTDVAELLGKLAAHGERLTRDELQTIVSTSDKQRFAFSPDGKRIRANQGHSIEVELDLPPAVPPEILFHGTADRFLESIRASGLIQGARHHVHLSADLGTAQRVGQRHGRVVVLEVAAGEMHRAGHTFFVSANGVWLAGAVPPQFLRELGSR